MLGVISKIRTHQEDDDLVSLDRLTLPNLVAQVKRRPMLGPEDLFQKVGVAGNLPVAKGHAATYKGTGLLSRSSVEPC